LELPPVCRDRKLYETRVGEPDQAKRILEASQI